MQLAATRRLAVAIAVAQLSCLSPQETLAARVTIVLSDERGQARPTSPHLNHSSKRAPRRQRRRSAGGWVRHIINTVDGGRWHDRVRMTHQLRTMRIYDSAQLKRIHQRVEAWTQLANSIFTPANPRLRKNPQLRRYVDTISAMTRTRLLSCLDDALRTTTNALPEKRKSALAFVRATDYLDVRYGLEGVGGIRYRLPTDAETSAPADNMGIVVEFPRQTHRDVSREPNLRTGCVSGDCVSTKP